MKYTATENKYSEILELQKGLNLELQELFESNKSKGRDKLVKTLANSVEEMVDNLNKESYKFGLCDYSGDMNYENSEQTYSDGEEMDTGVILHLWGFSIQAYWEGIDKYYSA